MFCLNSIGTESSHSLLPAILQSSPDSWPESHGRAGYPRSWSLEFRSIQGYLGHWRRLIIVARQQPPSTELWNLFPLPHHEVHQNHGQKVMYWPSTKLIPGVQVSLRLSWQLDKTHRLWTIYAPPPPIVGHHHYWWKRRHSSPSSSSLCLFVLSSIRGAH